eukprot:3339055-Rhodomonas_salina.1
MPCGARRGTARVGERRGARARQTRWGARCCLSATRYLHHVTPGVNGNATATAAHAKTSFTCAGVDLCCLWG